MHPRTIARIKASTARIIPRIQNKSFTVRSQIIPSKSNKTQQEIADILGTSQTMYARYERGANELPIRHLIKLCKYYKASADYILGLKG